MHNSPFLSSLTQAASNRLLLSSSCASLCYSYCSAKRPYYSITTKEFDLSRHNKSAVQSIFASNESSRTIHNAKAAGVNRPSPLLASSTAEMEKADIGQPCPEQCATIHRAMIALGSNIGDRVSMIEQACEKMQSQGIAVKATSLLYETAPMYVKDQEAFYNGVCEVRSDCSVA